MGEAKLLLLFRSWWLRVFKEVGFPEGLGRGKGEGSVCDQLLAQPSLLLRLWRSCHSFHMSESNRVSC